MYTPQEQAVLAGLLAETAHGQDQDEMAERLLKEFGSFSGVFEADRRALEKCGLTQRQAVLLVSLCAIARHCARARFSGHPSLEARADLDDYVRALYVGVRNERFSVLCMDGHSRLIEARTLAEGTLRGIRVQSRALIEYVVNTGARRVVFCHNHPGGEVSFSQADIQSTRVFWEELHTLGVTLQDHLLYAGGDVVSMREACGLGETFYFPPQRPPLVRAGRAGSR